MRLYGNTVSYTERINRAVDCYDYASRLVAQYMGLCHFPGTNAAMLPKVYIGAGAVS